MRRLLLVFLCLTLGASMARASALSKGDLLRELETWTSEIREWRPSESDAIERDLCLEWIYRLKFAVQSKYTETDASLLHLLDDLREVESDPENRGLSGLSTFLNALDAALKSDREPFESVFAFIKEFTEYGGVLSPPTADEFSETREYRSPGLSEAASVLELETATDRFEIHELTKPVDSQFTAKATVLDSAEGNLRIGVDEIIQGDETGFESTSDPLQPIGTLREDPAPQPVDRTVRQIERLVF